MHVYNISLPVIVAAREYVPYSVPWRLAQIWDRFFAVLLRRRPFLSLSTLLAPPLHLRNTSFFLEPGSGVLGRVGSRSRVFLFRALQWPALVYNSIEQFCISMPLPPTSCRRRQLRNYICSRL
jgi:hypothetical protein